MLLPYNEKVTGAMLDLTDTVSVSVWVCLFFLFVRCCCENLFIWTLQCLCEALLDLPW